MAFNESKDCLICQKEYNRMLPLEQCKLLNLPQTLENLHFASISNHFEKLGQVLCLICATKAQSCYELKSKCDQIAKTLESASDGTSPAWPSDSTMLWTPKTGHRKVKEKEDILTATPIPVDYANVKSEINIHEEIIPLKDEAQFGFRHTFVSNSNDENLRRKALICPICHKSFPTKCRLNRHYVIHAGANSHVCDVCNKAFFNSARLMQHKVIHNEKKAHVCKICDKSFTTFSSLVTHKVVHTGEKPHVCNVCNESFTSVSVLTKHKTIHLDDKRHVCDVCNRSFSYLTNLTKHKTVHKGVKPYVCDVCHKSFIASSSLITHKRIHMEDTCHVCDVCHKSFSQTAVLQKHKLIHFSTNSPCV